MSDGPAKTCPSSSRQPLITLVIVIALAYAWGAGLALLPVL